MRIIGNDPSVPRQEHAVASGTITNGKTVIVNTNGTVSAVAGTGKADGVCFVIKTLVIVATGQP